MAMAFKSWYHLAELLLSKHQEEEITTETH